MQFLGFDLAEGLRGEFADRSAFEAHFALRGGLLPVISRRVDPYLPRTKTPRAGDIGFVAAFAAHGERRPLAGICVGNAWWTKSEEGVAVMPFAPLRAWCL